MKALLGARAWCSCCGSGGDSWWGLVCRCTGSRRSIWSRWCRRRSCWPRSCPCSRWWGASRARACSASSSPRASRPSEAGSVYSISQNKCKHTKQQQQHKTSSRDQLLHNRWRWSLDCSCARCLGVGAGVRAVVACAADGWRCATRRRRDEEPPPPPPSLLPRCSLWPYCYCVHDERPKKTKNQQQQQQQQQHGYHCFLFPRLCCLPCAQAEQEQQGRSRFGTAARSRW